MEQVISRFPGQNAYDSLVESIREARAFPTFGRRAVLWLIECSRMETRTMAVFDFSKWGTELGIEIQRSADEIGREYHDRFLACETDMLFNQCHGGFDYTGRWQSEFPATTLWITDSADPPQRPDLSRNGRSSFEFEFICVLCANEKRNTVRISRKLTETRSRY